MPIKASVTGTINIDITDFSESQRVQLIRKYLYHERGRKEVVSSILVNGTTLHIPRNFKKFLTLCNKIGAPAIEFQDKRVVRKMEKGFSTKPQFELRDYQKKPVKDILKTLTEKSDKATILKAAPSFGKSFILPFVLEKMKMKTLILVDRTNLRDQMFEEFSKNAVGWVQIVDKDMEEIADVNIATFQTILKNPHFISQMAEQIGMVVVDEVHLISIGAFTNIVNKLPAKYRLGLSATPTRSDGLTEALFDVMSHNIVEGENPNLLGVKFLFVRTGISAFSAAASPQQRWMSFFQNPLLISLATKSAIKLTDLGRRVMIYSTYQDVQVMLREVITINSKYSVALVNAHTPAKDKMKIFKDFNAGKIDILITGVTTQKGVSIHNLDTIINYANHTKESFEQLVGRLRRDSQTKKKPIFIDFLTEGMGAEKSSDRLYYTERQKKDSDEVLIWSKDKYTKAVLGEE